MRLDFGGEGQLWGPTAGETGEEKNDQLHPRQTRGRGVSALLVVVQKLLASRKPNLSAPREIPHLPLSHPVRASSPPLHNVIICVLCYNQRVVPHPSAAKD